MLKEIFHKIWIKWDKYWFAEESVFSLAVFRIVFSIGVLIFHIPRMIFAPELYTEAGFLWPISPAADWIPAVIPLNLLGAYILNTVLLVSIAALLLGYKTRIVAFIAFSIHTYLVLLLNFGTYSTGRFISIFLFLLAFSPAGKILSLDAWRKHKTFYPYPVPVVSRAVRLLMIWQLAVIYISNASMKLVYGFEGWTSGDIIIVALKKPDWSQPWVWPLIRDFEGFVRIFIVTGFLLFLFLGISLLFERTRNFGFYFGLLWHFMTMFLTTITPVWLVWPSAYILLIREENLKNYFSDIYQYKITAHVVYTTFFIVLLVFSAFYGRF